MRIGHLEHELYPEESKLQVWEGEIRSRLARERSRRLDDICSGLADQDDVRLRFDVLTKTKQPELCRYWTTRDRAANVRLFRLASEVLLAIEAGVFHPVVGWQCKKCPFRGRCWAWE